VFDRLIPDEERRYSGIAAASLGIPIDYCVADTARPFDRWGQPDLRTPEPSDEPFLALLRDYYRGISQHARVALTGWDGDTLFAESPRQYFTALARSRRFLRLGASLFTYARAFHAPPPIGVRTTIKRWLRSDRPDPPQFPTWLHPDLVARLDLRARWDAAMATRPAPATLRPRAETVLITPLWLSLFERYDPGVTTVPLECRHPYADIRVVAFAVGIPVVPWCTQKTLLREATRGALPEAIRTRKKAALAGEPMLESVRRPAEAQRFQLETPVPLLTRYVDVCNLPAISGQCSLDSVYLKLRPLGLNYWLQGAQPAPKRGDRHGQREVAQVE
jgi:asparagine synthase (glutamine-hydrolysing)